MRATLTRSRLDFLLADHPPPCVSLYLPTHRRFPDNREDPIRFGTLVKQAEAALRERFPTREGREVLQPAHDLVDDGTFWKNHAADGLAVFAAPGTFHALPVKRTVRERVVVGDSFHIKPLVRIVQSADRFQVLGLSRRTMRLFEGDRYELEEIEPAQGVPRRLGEVPGAGQTKDRVEGTTRLEGPGVPPEIAEHAVTGDAEEDIAYFFRAVDEAVLKHHSQPTGLPLILAALPEYHALFRRLTQNRFLLDEAIEGNPDALTLDELRERAWRVLEPRYLQRLAGLVEQYTEARSKGFGTDLPEAAAEAACQSRIGTLLIEADRRIPGRIEAASGQFVPDPNPSPESDDFLDDLAELVLRRNGEVIVVPADRMPTNTGLAATFRF